MTPAGDGERVPSEPAARWLTRVLMRGLVPDDEPRVATVLANPGGHRDMVSVLAAEAARGPDPFARRLVERAREATEATATSNSGALARWKALGEAFEDQGIRWAALHGISHLGTLYPMLGGRLVRACDVLVHGYDAARARVLLASRGLTPVDGGHGPWRYRGREIAVTIFDELCPAAFPAVPLSPFLEGARLDEATMVRRMVEDAAFAAHRLLEARNLWDPAFADPLHAAEAAVLSRRAGEEAAELWSERAARWRVGRLWRRAAEVDGWLLGGERPEWLAPSYGTFPMAVVPRAPSVRQGLALQDGVVAMAGYLLRRLILRRA